MQFNGTVEEVKMSLKECIKIMADAYRNLEDTKEDCKDICNSAWDTLSEHDLTIKSANITKKEINKIAKSIASGKITDFEDEHTKIGILLEKALGYNSDKTEE